MGVDIYGVSPKLNGVRPEFPSDEVWETLSENARNEVFQQIHEFEENNPGYYFRNNWWAWRPIQYLIVGLNDNYGLGLTDEQCKLLGENSGLVTDDSETCNRIANALETVIADLKTEEIDKVSMLSGSWSVSTIFSDGRIGSTSANKYEIDQLNNKYGINRLSFEKEFFIDSKPDIFYEPSHTCSLKNIERFVAFLRNCNGFKIY